MYWLYRLLVWIFCFLAIKRGNDWNLLRKVALYKYWLVCKNTLKDLRIAFIISLSLSISHPFTNAHHRDLLICVTIHTFLFPTSYCKIKNVYLKTKSFLMMCLSSQVCLLRDQCNWLNKVTVTLSGSGVSSFSLKSSPTWNEELQLFSGYQLGKKQVHKCGFQQSESGKFSVLLFSIISWVSVKHP